jgi:predicted nucleotidyltransferase
MNIDKNKIAVFCKKWKIQELAIFGSFIRDDFNDQSDIDVLITFLPRVTWGFEIAELREELSLIFNRKIDLLNKRSLELSKNSYKKDEILKSCKVIYDQAA